MVEPGREENAYTLGVQAMLWGYPLVCQARTSEASVRVGAARVNALRRSTLKTAADRFAATPNNGTIDTYGWVDLRDGPVVLHVPTLTEPRWYLVQINDTFDEVADNVGGINGPGPGAYGITGPDFRGELPGEMTRVRLRTTQCSVAAHVFVAGQADLLGRSKRSAAFT